MNEQQFRAEFDARVDFSNGGHLEVAGFRVDVPRPDVTATEVAALFVASLGLLMSERVDVAALRVFPESHKGTRGGPSAVGVTPEDERRVVDLSHAIVPGMTTDRATRVDGRDLAALPVGRIADLATVVVRTQGSGSRAIDVGALAAFDVRGKAVLLHGGGDRAHGTPADATGVSYLTAAGAQWLADHGAALVGIDSIDIDDLGDPGRPARTILLAADVPIVEHLTGLEQLPPVGARFTAAPPRLARSGTVAVRAFAVI